MRFKKSSRKRTWRKRSFGSSRTRKRSPRSPRVTLGADCIVRIVGPVKRLREDGSEVANWDVFIADTSGDVSAVVGKCYSCFSLSRADRLGADISRSKGIPLRREASTLKDSKITFNNSRPSGIEDEELNATISELEDEWRCACT